MAEDPVTYEDLTEELKKKYDDIKALFEADLIGSFQRTRSHGIRWKGFSPKARSMEWICLLLQKNAPASLDLEKQAWLAKYATPANLQSSTPAANTVDQISAILRDQFGMVPKRRTIGYFKPYPNEYDLIPLPPKYRLPEFSKFSGSDGSSSIEHVSRYLAQLGTISASDPLRVRFFAQSLTGSAFGWYTSLPPDSIRAWKQMEEQFHMQYHSEASEVGIADLAQVRQKRGETVSEYISASDHQNRCYSARLTKEAIEAGGGGSRIADQGYGFPSDRSVDRKKGGDVSVFKRLGPLPSRNKQAESSRVEDLEELEDEEEEEEEEEEEDKYHRPRWCPDGLSHSQNVGFSDYVAWRKPKAVNKMLVDTGVAVNIMPYSMLRRLGRSSSDLIKTNVTLSDFNGQASKHKVF
ncbi:hypothetical protein QYE76_071281 [Lolium multiflorum]|uniref:Retrotransposon gag domain-containing protein n=1 Tax=Lolium multiflorum TaxID=4521 RepID=A0AAD8WEG5_LOLMU|nr:hypothetical protein QYE76_071281 [Lolium multiflorum]